MTDNADTLQLRKVKDAMSTFLCKSMYIGHIVHPVILAEKELRHLVVGKAGLSGNSLLYRAQAGLNSATLFSPHQTQDMNIIRLPNLSHTEIVQTLKDKGTMLAMPEAVRFMEEMGEAAQGADAVASVASNKLVASNKVTSSSSPPVASISG
ncbi:hypothetical protein LTS18_003742 [Coniosporium uncinatum]|uniref:Uncharacterized protein n=1 Tax=Coniosporium uncinatum TaxID=93489 RepID=A0ACC3D6C0_9PEZI|nr:hypothetical protein LTS18_003742 [Coniosporium uncinatum]